jgi:hypothetical protein
MHPFRQHCLGLVKSGFPCVSLNGSLWKYLKNEGVRTVVFARRMVSRFAGT